MRKPQAALCVGLSSALWAALFLAGYLLLHGVPLVVSHLKTQIERSTTTTGVRP